MTVLNSSDDSGPGLEDIDDDQLITLMAENPILIERPIIFNETKAVIGRPPENTLDII